MLLAKGHHINSETGLCVYRNGTFICLHLAAHWTAKRSHICPSIARGQSGNVKSEMVKKLIYGERFHYPCSRGGSQVPDVIWGIKLRDVFETTTIVMVKPPKTTKLFLSRSVNANSSGGITVLS